MPNIHQRENRICLKLYDNGHWEQLKVSYEIIVHCFALIHRDQNFLLTLLALEE